MSQQPEALRLAEALLKAPGSGQVTGYLDEAAPELRRLHAQLVYANEVIDQRNAMVSAANAEAATLRAQVERLQAAGQVVAWRNPETDEVVSDSRRTLWIANDGGYKLIAEKYTQPLTTPAQEAADTGADWPKPSQWDSPLSDFQDGQWWVKELDSMVSAGGTPDQKRAVAVVHHLLRAALAARSGQVAASAMVPLDEPEPVLLGRFHHGQGFLCSGSMRVLRADFDTNPSDEFQVQFFDWVCAVMNQHLKRANGLTVGIQASGRVGK